LSRKNNAISPQERISKLRRREKSAYAGMVAGGLMVFEYVLLYFYQPHPSFISWPSFWVFVTGVLIMAFSFFEVIYCRARLQSSQSTYAYCSKQLVCAYR
jgi:hypothetical protein